MILKDEVPSKRPEEADLKDGDEDDAEKGGGVGGHEGGIDDIEDDEDEGGDGPAESDVEAEIEEIVLIIEQGEFDVRGEWASSDLGEFEQAEDEDEELDDEEEEEDEDGDLIDHGGRGLGIPGAGGGFGEDLSEVNLKGSLFVWSEIEEAGFNEDPEKDHDEDAADYAIEGEEESSGGSGRGSGSGEEEAEAACEGDAADGEGEGAQGHGGSGE